MDDPFDPWPDKETAIKAPVGRWFLWLLLTAGAAYILWRYPERFPHPDIFLGVDLVLMAAVGGIVSAHGPKVWIGKFLYSGTFILLGTIGMRLVIQQSTETEAAENEYKQTLKNIAGSTAETTRLQGLNTTLQQRLLTATSSLADLSRMGIDTSTGGNSWAHLRLVIDQSRNASVVVLQDGQFPLADVELAIKNAEAPKVERPFFSAQIGTLPVKGARVIGSFIVPDVQEKRYLASFVARNGNWDQLILLRRQGNRWFGASVIQQNPGQVRFEELKHLPGPSMHPDIDANFPGSITENEWLHGFSGQFLFCVDCGTSSHGSASK